MEMTLRPMNIFKEKNEGLQNIKEKKFDTPFVSRAVKGSSSCATFRENQNSRVVSTIAKKQKRSNASMTKTTIAETSRRDPL